MWGIRLQVQKADLGLAFGDGDVEGSSDVLFAGGREAARWTT